jgi:serine/threonine-protein kinase Chk1
VLTCRVFLAVNDETSKLAACKVVNLWIDPALGTGAPNIKELQKEVQIHKAMSHDYILRFMGTETYDMSAQDQGYVPGLYMLLELAQSGDLFDKIGESRHGFTLSRQCRM